ncbi:hypothetical protein [Thermococcus sp. 21S7]|uniref:hypothetical protein n=1 Tax=Thermococcus sp. 21S7 TaxID=1638221 RepID=UPI001981E326|nr:hypothetical protein [Thermococcus sp. 21S7]
MGSIVVRVPPTVDEKLAKLIAKAIVGRLESLERVNELLKNSELTEEEAIELEGRQRPDWASTLREKYSP